MKKFLIYCCATNFDIIVLENKTKTFFKIFAFWC